MYRRKVLKMQRYDILRSGKYYNRYLCRCILHIDIKGNKIWLQWNGTEDDIAADLVNAGVPKEDIVLGFQSPFMQQFTEYAVG